MIAKYETELIDSHFICTFKKNQTVLIPSVVRKQTALFPGDEVSVSFREALGEIVVSRNTKDTMENRMIINKSGGFRVPSEIQRIADLTAGDILRVFVFKDFNGIVFKIISK
ncbi:hypothetical protein [Salipaludibacillus aurantiacus]|uniref:Looped-hinge helix DNA binding domain-containing protein, AbrB family n=1 Tax=Salipaludibacillus aurantiacus TaxID=1601833 RepID=A0A1H9V1F9_9BACI|nr:hypothetical protein [Salipaludibacillus aurantiacus]SES15117.1 hypothetical protein SAMN05518684_10949 [Salipaludibacillus aurantiacus]